MANDFFSCPHKILSFAANDVLVDRAILNYQMEILVPWMAHYDRPKMNNIVSHTNTPKIMQHTAEATKYLKTFSTRFVQFTGSTKLNVTNNSFIHAFNDNSSKRMQNYEIFRNLLSAQNIFHFIKKSITNNAEKLIATGRRAKCSIALDT